MRCKERQVYLDNWLGIDGKENIVDSFYFIYEVLHVEYISVRLEVDLRMGGVWKAKDLIWTSGRRLMRRRQVWPLRSSSDPRSDPGERVLAGQARAGWAGCRTWRGGGRAGSGGGGRRGGGSGCCKVRSVCTQFIQQDEVLGSSDLMTWCTLHCLMTLWACCLNKLLNITFYCIWCSPEWYKIQGDRYAALLKFGTDRQKDKRRHLIIPRAPIEASNLKSGERWWNEVNGEQEMVVIRWRFHI